MSDSWLTCIVQVVNSGFTLTVKSSGALPVFSINSVKFNLSPVSTFTSRAKDAGPTSIPVSSSKFVANDSNGLTVKITVSLMFSEGSASLVTEHVTESVLPAAGRPSATGGTYNLTCIGRYSRISRGSKE